MSYTYDLAGDMTSYSNAAGVTFTQSFDTAGRATQLISSYVDANHPTTLATVDSSLGFYPTGALRKITYGNGLTATTAIEGRLQPCRINLNSTGSTITDGCADGAVSGTVQDFFYAYGTSGSTNNGNVTIMNAGGLQNFNRTFTFDSLNRLATMSDAHTSNACLGLQWTYDAWGNRTDQTVTAGICNTFHQAVNTNNRLSGSPYAYDAAGNMTHDASHGYSYDAENRLVAVDGGSTASYVYDALGRRVRKTVAGVWTDYILDLVGNVVAEMTTNGWQVGYNYFNGQLQSEYRGSTTYFIHGDHLGSTRLVSGLEANQAPNGNFEQGSVDWLPDTGASVVNDPTKAHSGSYYLQISTSTGAEAENSQLVAVSPGQTVTFGGWAYRESGTAGTDGLGRWQLIAYDANQNPVTYPGTSPSDVQSAAWTFQQGTYTIPPSGVSFVRLYCNVYQPTAATVVRCDDGFLYIDGVAVSIVQNLDYLPFGEINSTDSGITSYKFTGKERDNESGLDNFGARYNSSQLGRFMTPDWSAKPQGVPYAVLDDPQSLNLYSYVRNNPLNLTDPTGHYELNASGCGDNAKCQKKWDKAANKFEVRREKDLHSKKADVRAAAENFGARGEANGVHLGFANLASHGINGSVDASGSVGGTPLVQVTIDFGRAGNAETITHEGTHIGDDTKFLNSFNPLTGGYDQGLNLTHGQTEFNAFKAGAEITHEHGFGPNDDQKIWNFLRGSPTYGRILDVPVFDRDRFPAGAPPPNLPQAGVPDDEQ